MELESTLHKLGCCKTWNVEWNGMEWNGMDQQIIWLEYCYPLKY